MTQYCIVIYDIVNDPDTPAIVAYGPYNSEGAAKIEADKFVFGTPHQILPMIPEVD